MVARRCCLGGAVAGVLGTMLVLKLFVGACGWERPALHMNSPSGHTASAAMLHGGLAVTCRHTGRSCLRPSTCSPKLKALLRSAAARTREGLWNTIGQFLNRFSPDECRNHLGNSGYEFN